MLSQVLTETAGRSTDALSFNMLLKQLFIANLHPLKGLKPPRNFTQKDIHIMTQITSAVERKWIGFNTEDSYTVYQDNTGLLLCTDLTLLIPITGILQMPNTNIITVLSFSNISKN